MRFRIPKPLHGWREFCGEVGIIVIGVLIALGAQQVVETLHDRHELNDAKSRLREELRGNAAQGVERLAVGPCLIQRIGVLATGLAKGRTNWNDLVSPPVAAVPTALGALYRKPTRNWSAEEYRQATTVGNLDTADQDWRSELSSAYLTVDALRQVNAEEQELANTLAPLQFNPPLTSPERNAMIATLARLDRDNGMMILVSRQLFEAMRKSNLTVPTNRLFSNSRIGGWSQELGTLRDRFGPCVNANALKEYDDIAIRGKPTA